MRAGLLLITALMVTACEPEPIVFDNPDCPTKVAYEQGIKFIEADLKYPASSKLPSYDEDRPMWSSTCEFYWLPEIDAANAYGALRRTQVSIEFHYNKNNNEWVLDSLLIV